jgi:hypothetical protein
MSSLHFSQRPHIPGLPEAASLESHSHLLLQGPCPGNDLNGSQSHKSSYLHPHCAGSPTQPAPPVENPGQWPVSTSDSAKKRTEPIGGTGSVEAVYCLRSAEMQLETFLNQLVCWLEPISANMCNFKKRCGCEEREGIWVWWLFWSSVESSGLGTQDPASHPVPPGLWAHLIATELNPLRTSNSSPFYLLNS